MESRVVYKALGLLAIAALPAAVGLLVLLSRDQLSATAAVVLALLVVVGTGGVVLHLVRQDRELRQNLESLAEGGPGVAQKALDPTTRRVARAWSRASETQETRAGLAERIFDTLPDPVFLLNGERRVLRVNTAAERLVGRDLTGRDLTDGLRDPDLLDAIDEAQAFRHEVTVELTVPVPTERTFLVRVEPVDGSPAFEDVTLLVAFQELTSQRKSERLRADFVANVSHELRTPLTSLIGFLETVRGPAWEDRAAQQQFLAIMQEQADRMFRLISDLLSLSRIEMEEHTQPADHVDIGRILGSVRDTVSIKAKEKEMPIHISLPPDLPDVLGDEDQLTQVFQNLIDNAVKYGRQGTEITVTGKENGPDTVTITVQDQGVGIPKQDLPRLTERFYRVDPARSRELGGTGLGLAIVKHIVNRHRGRLSIESAVGEGSAFTIALPRA